MWVNRQDHHRSLVMPQRATLRKKSAQPHSKCFIVFSISFDHTAIQIALLKCSASLAKSANLTSGAIASSRCEVLENILERNNQACVSDNGNGRVDW
jgi:hypothetical protein